MTPAETVADLAAELGQLLPELVALLPEPVADATTGSSQHHKVTGSPAPWHAEAAGVLFTIHAGVRDLEQDLIYVVSGQLRDRRGGSDGNTLAALAAITRLVHGAPETRTRQVQATLSGWIHAACQVRDIGRAERWIPIHVPAGELPPACPYCSTYSIRLAQESGRVRCANGRCRDIEGNPRAVASTATSSTARR
nr:hypothetical protein GCM10020093_084110 [Planobispora longispora]